MKVIMAWVVRFILVCGIAMCGMLLIVDAKNLMAESAFYVAAFLIGFCTIYLGAKTASMSDRDIYNEAEEKKQVGYEQSRDN